MTTPVIFVDDDEIERRSCIDVLTEIFADTSIRVAPMAPLPALADYAEFLVNDVVSAFILDERLNTSGNVCYTGAELAAHLRAIGGNMPIVILTNYPDDDFASKEWAVERITEKKSVLKSPTAPAAQAFKARLSREIEIAGNVLFGREERYRDLLVKSVAGNLTSEEEAELSKIEAERIAPVAASEREKGHKLDAEIEKLKKLLGDGGLL
jgi:hypothetical protein